MDNPNITKKQLPSGFPFISYKDSYALCGQPQVKDLEKFKELSWTHILNLRNPEELLSLDFERPQLCEKLSLSYSHIPIMINGELDKQALQESHELLNSKKDVKIVIHCASGARSAVALMAHFLFLKKYNKEEISGLAPQLGLNSPQMLSRLYETMEN